jgi:hypothetical protein
MHVWKIEKLTTVRKIDKPLKLLFKKEIFLLKENATLALNMISCKVDCFLSVQQKRVFKRSDFCDA